MIFAAEILKQASFSKIIYMIEKKKHTKRFHDKHQRVFFLSSLLLDWVASLIRGGMSIQTAIPIN